MGRDSLLGGVAMYWRKLASAAVFSVCIAGASEADSFDTTVLFSKSDWTVELTHDTSDGELWCSAQTTNRAGQSFHLTAYDTDTLRLFVFDHNWNIAPRNVRFLVDIDYSRWTIDGHGQDISVSLALNDPEQAVRFIEQLMEGNAVAVMNADGRRLAVFSLSGSYAAISKLFECWERISRTDPFGPSPNDPFTGVGAGDPF